MCVNYCIHLDYFWQFGFWIVYFLFISWISGVNWKWNFRAWSLPYKIFVRILLKIGFWIEEMLKQGTNVRMRYLFESSIGLFIWFVHFDIWAKFMVVNGMIFQQYYSWCQYLTISIAQLYDLQFVVLKIALEVTVSLCLWRFYNCIQQNNNKIEQICYTCW